MMMVGHLGELALSSAAMALSLSGVTGFSLMVFNPFLFFNYY
jgi:MATE family multidrug resistance protein